MALKVRSVALKKFFFVAFSLLLVSQVQHTTAQEDEGCPDGFEYQECGTACPKTCSNFNDEAMMCVAMCVEGCFCPRGMILDEQAQKCVRSPQECSNTPNLILETENIPNLSRETQM
mmetsp:Transcript_22706/g.44556  ORF Transcript_22706/g.44556 Transcript_22706/m.44556 type:complete len:117 (-) Transcript_22706:228-578(-)